MTRIASVILLGLSLVTCQSAKDALPRVDSVTSTEVTELLDEHRGKVVVVNVWATWCAPCREEMPSLVKLRREFRGRGVELILISADDAEIVETKVRPMLKEFGVDFPSYVSTSGDEEFINALSTEWAGALPTTFIYDRAGRLMDTMIGMQSYEKFVDAISKAMNS